MASFRVRLPGQRSPELSPLSEISLCFTPGSRVTAAKSSDLGPSTILAAFGRGA